MALTTDSYQLESAGPHHSYFKCSWPLPAPLKLAWHIWMHLQPGPPEQSHFLFLMQPSALLPTFFPTFSRHQNAEEAIPTLTDSVTLVIEQKKSPLAIEKRWHPGPELCDLYMEPWVLTSFSPLGNAIPKAVLGNLKTWLATPRHASFLALSPKTWLPRAHSCCLLQHLQDSTGKHNPEPPS